MIHISPWACTEALVHEASDLLNEDQLLILYGPFKIDNKHTSKSNFHFDLSLKAQNPSWGVRDLDQVCELGKENGLDKHDVIQMPANNLTLILHSK